MKSILGLLLPAAMLSGQISRPITIDPATIGTTKASGFTATQMTPREPGFDAFLGGLAFAEHADKPCLIEAHWWRHSDKNFAAGTVTKFNICSGTEKPDQSLLFPQRADLRLAVDSVAVCPNGNDKHRLKGVILTAGSIDRFESGDVDDAVQALQFKRPNCTKFQNPKSCGAGKVAIGLEIHHTKDEITGLALKCAKPVVIASRLPTPSSAAERYSRMENDIRVQTGKEGESQVMSITGAIGKHEVAGAGVVVLEGGKISVVRRYGYRNKKKNLLTTPDTFYYVASLSKLPAALAMLAAARRSHGPSLQRTVAQTASSKPDSTIGQWVDKQFKGDEKNFPKEITLLRLLSHTAGLSEHGIGTAHNDGNTLLESILLGKDGRPGVKPLTRPGSDWQYSGGGFTVAETMLRVHAPDSVPNFLKEHILKPFGMTKSKYDDANDDMTNLARGCSRGLCSDNPGWTKAKFAGGLLAHPEDYARLLVPLLNDGKDESGKQLIDPADLDLLFTPAARRDSSFAACTKHSACADEERCYGGQCIHPLAADEKDGTPGTLRRADWYGLGVYLERDNDYKKLPRIVSHGGANSAEGAASAFEIDRKTGNGVVIIVNGEYDWKKSGVTYGADALVSDILDSFQRNY